MASDLRILSVLLWHESQRQDCIQIMGTSSHILPVEKQTQYILRHWLFRQLQPVYLECRLRGGGSMIMETNFVLDLAVDSCS